MGERVETRDVVINRYFEQINENASRQEEIQRVLSVGGLRDSESE